MSLNQDLHDRMWRAFQRWHELREAGVSRHEVKLQGIREARDPNLHSRNLLFSGDTLRSYEEVLKQFVQYVSESRPIGRLEDIGKKDFRAFMDRAIEKGLAVRTLNKYKSALAKFGALTGKTQSFVALSQKYGRMIREMAREGTLPGPTRQTPSQEVLQRAVAVLAERDRARQAQSGVPRAYSLAARLQIETSARSVSVSSRFSAGNLLDGSQVRIIGKGGKEQIFTISHPLHWELTQYFKVASGTLAGQRAYQAAYSRAIKAVGGHVTGTHGARRASIRDFYLSQYKMAIGQGVNSREAAATAAADSVERLGHGRDRMDHREWYLGR